MKGIAKRHQKRIHHDDPPGRKSSNRLYLNFLLVILLLFSTVPYAAARAQQRRGKERSEQIGQRFSRPDSAYIRLKKQYDEAVSNHDELLSATYLQQMGQILYASGHYPQALENLLRAGNIFRSRNEEKLMAQNLSALGELYYNNKQIALARRQYEEALVHYQNLKLESGKADIYGRLGHLCEKTQRYDSAFYFQRKALSLYQKVNLQEQAAKIYENIGSIYEDKANYDSAYFYFKKAYELNEVHGHQRAQVEVLNNLGDVLRKTGRYREGLNFSFRALSLAERNGDYDQLSGAYNDIAKAYNFLNKNDSAFHYLTLSRTSQSDIYTDEGNKQLALLQTLYETDKKDKEINALTLVHQQDILLATAAGVVGLFVFLITALVISRQKLKIKNEQNLHAESRKVFEAQNQLMEVELRNKNLEEENLRQQLELKTKELSSYTLNVIRKNQLLEDLRQSLEAMFKEDKRDQKKQIRKLSEQIGESLTDDKQWDEFRGIFEQVHQSFFDRLQQVCDSLTTNDLRLIALIKMNLTSADMITLLGISQDSLRVLRHRLRKKLSLDQGENLSTFIQSI